MNEENTAPLSYQPGDSVHGFTVKTAELLSEIDGNAYVMVHNASGARLLYLQNDDDDKAFSIAFKTPPKDDTGVFHILEHSVLCGSEKFPVKEPFVNLLKTSMQTFLNAMTFPDKTMYPVASTNEQDLMNLADVYMDAVLHPAIYRKRTIFEQEGWHYELAENENNRLAYNGVVFNEMKGALSDPDSVLYDTLSAALFPDTAYRFESGGTPEVLVQLTYEDFLDHHARHYRLDNSYITLYGNLNANRFLTWLDENYLSAAARPTTGGNETKPNADADGENANAAVVANPGQPNALDIQAPVLNFGSKKTMVTAAENACMALGYVVGTARDRQRLIATDIVMDAIMGSNEAPLKRALLDADLADDAQAYLADAILQPFVVIQLKGLRPGASDRFRNVVESAVRSLIEGALDHALLEASLAHSEFVMREHSFGMSDGVALAMASLSGWLYDDDMATAFVRYEDDFAFLREQLETDYFEQLLRSLFLENGHAASAEIVPVENADYDFEAEGLAKAAASLDKDGFARIANDVASLRAAQEECDSPEALATLPRMRVSDIDLAPAEPPYQLIEGAPVPCLRHHIPTRGIVYAYRYFGLERVSFEELPYITVLAMVLGKLDTAVHSASEIDTLVQSRLGNLSFFAEVHERENDRNALTPKFAVSASALGKNVEHLAQLPNEILLTTRFNDLSKIKDVLVQKRIAMEQGFAAAGHNAAMARAASYYLPAGVAREQLGGVDFYRFLKDLIEHFDERGESLSLKLRDLRDRLFCDDNLLVSFTGTDEDLEHFWAAGGTTGRVSTTEADGSFALGYGNQLEVPGPVAKNEAFIVPSDVTYAALAFDRRLLDAPYSGAWPLASRILSYDYLWNEVRVKGGAYGAGFQVTRTGTARFYSYRDPHLDETLKRFSMAGKWLSTFVPDFDEMEGYIVSAVAGLDAPQKPREQMRRQDGWFFACLDADSRAKTRQEVIAAMPNDLRKLAPVIEGIAQQHMMCVFGSKDIIGKSKEGFEVIDLLANEQSSAEQSE